MATLDDPEVRAAYLKAIREGKFRHKAARAIGVDGSTVRRYMVANPEFEQMVLDAEEENSETLLDAQRSLAVEGDTTAAKLVMTVLRKRDIAASREDRRTMVQVNITRDDILANITDLVGALQKRHDVAVGTPRQNKPVIEARVKDL